MATAQFSRKWDISLWNDAPGTSLVSFDQWLEIRKALKLSGRELDVCRLLFAGRSRGEVSDELGLKFSTVRQYTEQLHSKLRVHSRVELVLRVIQVRDWIIEQSQPETNRFEFMG